MATDRRAIEIHRFEARDRRCKRRSRLFLDQQAGHAVHDRIERAAAAVRDHGPPAGHHLDRRHPEVFELREEQRARTAHEVDQLFVRDVAANVDVRIPGRKARRSADDDQLSPRQSRRFDREVDALVGHRPRGDQIVLLG